MRRYLIILAALLAVSCSDANRQYVRKAVRIMDKQGLFAEVAGVQQHSRIECPVAILTDSLTARTGEVFCDDPIQPDVLAQTPLEDALGWINNRP